MVRSTTSNLCTLCERRFLGGVQAIVSLDETEDEEKFVNIEAFALSDQIIKLCKEGWFAEEQETEDVEKMGLLHTNKDVIVAGKDTQQVDTDFLIIAVPILDHQVRGNLSAPTLPRRPAARRTGFLFLVAPVFLGQLRGSSSTISAVSRLAQARQSSPRKDGSHFATPTGGRTQSRRAATGALFLPCLSSTVRHSEAAGGLGGEGGPKRGCWSPSFRWRTGL